MPDYLLYKLTWDEAKQKYAKRPCRIDGVDLAAGESPPRVSYEVAAAAVRPGYALGMWIDPPMFFIDLDECVVDGQLSPDAARLAAPFVAAGCFFEASSSGRGAHIIGCYHGDLPAHSNKRPAVHKYEFYVRDRGVALNLPASQGCMSVDATELMLAMLAEFFPPRNDAATLMPTSERRPEWRGPEDDDELIRRALVARGSARQVFGGAWSFADLWAGNVPETSRSEADLAMASHLAFWTGCDVPRIERIMRRSGLMRDKWNDHRTYLRDMTIIHACATTRNVYQEPERKNVVAELMGTPAPAVPVAAVADGPVADYYALVDQTIAAVNNTGTFRELMDNVVPGIAPLQLPHAHAERVVQALMKRLALFDAKLPIGSVRQLVTPPVSMSELAPSAPPPWFQGFCYVKRTDKFYNVNTASEYSVDSLRMEFSKFMPLKPNGTREDPVAWARDRWNIITVDDAIYRPDQPEFFEYAGQQFVNKFNPNSMPALQQPSEHALACIEHFKSHLYLMCNKRDWLYFLLLQWLAHNVQRPGHKIRWSPLVKGVGGDGKSIIGDLIFAVMGEANVKMTSPATLTNSGGFTDWATGACVNFIEEIRLEGQKKKQLYNAMKIFIGDHRSELNRKGKASGATERNITNHWANSNYSDAAPVDDDERRWLIIFSPYNDIHDAVAAKGYASVDELVKSFKMMGASMRSEPGAWRAWLMSVDTSSFDPDGRAPHTPERDSMRLASSDSLDQTTMDIINTGGFGITATVFASDCLAGRVAVEYGDHPRQQGWNALLTRLGFIQHSKPIWWSGKTRRIWTKKTMNDEKIKEILDTTMSCKGL